ncbi:hypothetical protein Mzhil_0143 [Methanosalsum zhilinae DSM 4017]|uniref:Uncharacterized protein n=1 Tax=Methanosalsum zhilinae (strain DSM 4017 / NBRC 107636 / OCM 62 / WeN5) TaxID=679901 RepID=F7XN66_METZD|nr:hypothetical protein [Methanosalsum zhilinae]AEH60023.1 hypothetical protein Mzhil_0143 [Methanosalsum zhilinae DSM 4017]
MDIYRKLLVILIVLLMLFGFIFANIAVAGERTLLNSGFVKDTLDDGEIHYSLHGEFVTFLQELPEEGEEEIPELFLEVMEDVISPDFIRQVLHSNVDAFYGYIDGESEKLLIDLHLDRIENRTDETLKDRFLENNVSQILKSLSQNNDEDFDDVLHEYQGVEYTVSMIDTMLEDEYSYSETISEYRKELEDVVPEDEVDSVIADILDDISEADTVNEEDVLAEQMNRLFSIPLESMISETDYDQFKHEMDQQRTQIALSYSSMMFDEVEREIPHGIDISEEIDDEEFAYIENARNIIQMSWMFIIGSLLAIILLAYLVWTISRSPAVPSFAVGIAAIAAGIAGAVGSWSGKRVLDSLLEEISVNTPQIVLETIEIFMVNIMDVFLLQSIAIAAMGAVFVTISLYIKKRTSGQIL